jgi:hypothetical protein
MKNYHQTQRVQACDTLLILSIFKFLKLLGKNLKLSKMRKGICRMLEKVCLKNKILKKAGFLLLH